MTAITIVMDTRSNEMHTMIQKQWLQMFVFFPSMILLPQVRYCCRNKPHSKDYYHVFVKALPGTIPTATMTAERTVI